MREALIMLNIAHMVVIKPQSGTHVAPIDLKLMEMEQFARFTLEKELLNHIRGRLTGEQESDLRVYWQDNTLRIVSESPGEVTLHLKDLRDTYQFPAGGCVITDFADGKIIVQ